MKKKKRKKVFDLKDIKTQIKKIPLWLRFMIVLFITIVIVNMIYTPGYRNAEEVSVLILAQDIEKGSVKKIEIQKAKQKYISGYNVYWEFKDNYNDTYEEYMSFIEENKIKEYNDIFKKYNVEVKETKQIPIILVSSWVILGLMAFFMILKIINDKFFRGKSQRLGPGMDGFTDYTEFECEEYDEDDNDNNENGKKKKKSRTTLKDVAGCDQAKEEAREMIEFLKAPKRLTRLGGKMPKGAALIGHPGCGKTLLARAIAGEAGVPFFSQSGSVFIEKFVGVGASRIRDLFKKAREKAPCIIFIDEAESIGGRGGNGINSAHDEAQQTMDELLSQMDGFNPLIGILVIFATNLPDKLDPALLRSGRIDRYIVVDKPDLETREAIFHVHSKNKVMSPDKDEDLRHMAEITTGLTGADIENIMNKAAIYAAKNDDRKYIKRSDLEYGFEHLGDDQEQKGKVMDEKEKERVAYHESGHAIIAELLPDCPKPRKVSIIPRTRALGVTILTESEKKLMTKNQFEAVMSMLYGGRIAEEVIYNGDVSNGAQNGLERGTKIAEEFVCMLGMIPSIGARTFGTMQQSNLYGQKWKASSAHSQKKIRLIDEEIDNLINERYKIGKEIILSNMNILERMVKILLKKETIQREEIVKIIRDAKQLTFDFGKTHKKP